MSSVLGWHFIFMKFDKYLRLSMCLGPFDIHHYRVRTLLKPLIHPGHCPNDDLFDLCNKIRKKKQKLNFNLKQKLKLDSEQKQEILF